MARAVAAVREERQVEGFTGVWEARVESVDDRPFPVQVDGDYIGEFDEVQYGVLRSALLAVV